MATLRLSNYTASVGGTVACELLLGRAQSSAAARWWVRAHGRLHGPADLNGTVLFEVQGPPASTALEAVVEKQDRQTVVAHTRLQVCPRLRDEVAALVRAPGEAAAWVALLVDRLARRVEAGTAGAAETAGWPRLRERLCRNRFSANGLPDGDGPGPDREGLRRYCDWLARR